MIMIGCAGPPTPENFRMYHNLVVECGSVTLLSQVLSIRVMLEVLEETTA
jgi:hypothetical protein